MNNRQHTQSGAVSGWMIAAIASIVLFVAAGSFAIWAYINYSDQKQNVDSKIDLAVAEARKQQADKDAADFAEREKNPKLQFVGSSDYGRVSFMYPKTWSVYVDQDGSDRGDYRVYLNPGTIPPVGNKGDANRFAVRLEVLNENLDRVMNSYKNQIKKGDLRSSSTEVNGISATRLDGAMTKEKRGSIVIFRLRDKVVRFSTDANTFKPDFDTLLSTVTVAE